MSKSIDQRLVGVWKGSDNGTYNFGEVNNWILKRLDNGRFTVTFETTYYDGSVENFEDEGSWYVDGDYYYEQADEDDDLDCYVFTVLSSKAIHFIDTELNYGSTYQFTDYKVQLD